MKLYSVQVRIDAEVQVEAESPSDAKDLAAAEVWASANGSMQISQVQCDEVEEIDE